MTRANIPKGSFRCNREEKHRRLGNIRHRMHLFLVNSSSKWDGLEQIQTLPLLLAGQGLTHPPNGNFFHQNVSRKPKHLSLKPSAGYPKLALLLMGRS
jgi:hypothetical protein